MPHMKNLVAPLALYLVVFLGCVLLVGAPACNKNQRQKTLHASVVAVNTARDGFLEWDRLHQLAIVEQAATREAGEQALAAYRLKRTPVAQSFETTYRALALAATQTDDASFREALQSASDLVKAITVLKESI